MSATATSRPPQDADPPDTDIIRAEPYSIHHLEDHARRLATELPAQLGHKGDQAFLKRIRENAHALREAHRIIADATNAGETATVDVEWLLDNFSIVEEQLTEIQEDLPRGYYRELPKTENGNPRVYRLALDLIAHTDSALDEETLVRFLQAFQESSPLSIGETWAFPIMLRLALVENLRRISAQMLAHRECRRRANHTITSLDSLKRVDLDPNSLARCAPMLMEMLEQLEELGTEGSTRMTELERRIAQLGWDVADIVREAHRSQAANQVSIGNVITSMRLISALDWMAFFEQTNLAERALQQDPTQVYMQMDSSTRDRYRREVERVAKRSGVADQEVAKLAILCARQAAERSMPLVEQHVGFYLIGDGRKTLRDQFQYQPILSERVAEFILRNSMRVYLGGVGIVTLWLLAVAAAVIIIAGGSFAVLFVMLAALAIPATEVAVGFINVIVTSILPPRLLPKLEFREGIPNSYATMVVVPTMLSSEKDIHSLVERLELHYLSNQDATLRFALLTDYVDAQDATTPKDLPLRELAVAEIRRLNLQYGENGRGPFYLFHRRREWNAAEGKWMGWERKRGKLMTFNRWLLGRPTTYEVIEGDQEAIRLQEGKTKIQFVITLDADTQLPPGTAKKMVGTLSHPLNRPHFIGKRVNSGYVILQPRVGVDLAAANRTWYARLFANSPGIDPYATAASDVYQDLFGEGSFTGKGIYDLRAFERALEDAFPENSVLSHDLIEGCHSRVGLVSDVELIDGFPTRYDAEAKRQHRWTRGDWQILPWLFPTVPSEHGPIPNSLSMLSRWKVGDNLRRSLVSPMLLIAVIFGWITLPRLAASWSLLCLSVVAFPLVGQLFITLLHWPSAETWLDYRRGRFAEFGRTCVQAILQLVFLPHRAFSMVDAIARTLVRMFVTKKNLLEWETAAAAEQRLSSGSWLTLPMLLASPALVFVLLAVVPVPALPAAAFFLACWFSAPLVAYLLNQPLASRETSLSEEQKKSLRLAARRTWSYFERYVTEEENWLPPDNVQEYPTEKVAHRVSPTNEGLFLLSAIAAREFGFISLNDLTSLLERNLATWQRFSSLHGHFYNWYDTVSLQPLHPRYVSTVDSGNLAVSFLTLHSGIHDLRKSPLFTAALWDGVLDSATVIQQEAEKLQPRGALFVSPPLDNLLAAISAIAACGGPPQTLVEWHLRLRAVREKLPQLDSRIIDFVASRAHPLSELPPLVEHLQRLLTGIDKDFDSFFPWLTLIVDRGVSPQSSIDELPPPFPLITPAGTAGWDALKKVLLGARTLGTLIALPSATAEPLRRLHDEWLTHRLNQVAAAWLTQLRIAIENASSAAFELDQRLERLAGRVESLALQMDFSFLYNAHRRLFSIGFNIEDGQLDRSHYDMLASEARLASYLAIAKGDVDYRTWFRMGRGLVRNAGEVGLISWGGTMFEYLMPQIFHRAYQNSLLVESCRMAVARQIEYGRQCGVPWGISESAFSALAVNSDYHYKSFGTPGLGLKRGLGKDLVVSPYSTFLALELDSQAAFQNLQLLAKEGGGGTWGYFDAIDYTRERLPADRRSLVVRCYMAHHQGMSMMALANAIFGGRIREWFHEHPLAKAGELLLQERVPAGTHLVQPPDGQVLQEQPPRVDSELVSRRLNGYETSAPRTHLLANGNYAVMVTNTGGGYSRYRDLAVTRWQCDATRDNWGQFVYIRDVASGRVWSATYQPTRAVPDAYHVIYSIDKAEFHRRDGVIETHLEITVSPEHQAEMRLLKITNHSSKPLELEITSYAEVVLAPPAADQSHPAFHKLFIETEFLAEGQAIIARRRPRDAKDPVGWAVHVLAASSHTSGELEYETSREQFLGRGGTPALPQALQAGAKLSGSVGAVLDTIFSLRQRVVVPPHESATLAFTTAIATSREEAVSLADAHRDLRGVQRAFELSWAFKQVELRHLHLSPAKSHLFQRLASALLYPDPTRRVDAAVLSANRQGQSGLWRFGISGDLPIVMVHIAKPEHLEMIRDLMVAHRYWREHRLVVDLVIVNDNPGSYIDALQEQLVNVVNELCHAPDNKPANIILLRGAQISREDQILLESTASVLLHCNRGSLAKQLEPITTSKPVGSGPLPITKRNAPPNSLPGIANAGARKPGTSNGHASVPKPSVSSVPWASDSLLFWNGVGGFSADGSEYAITVQAKRRPCKPWSNILANPRFGTLITESGGGYTWSENSREYKLTTWQNDPLLDTPAEWLYLRDERTREIFRPLPQAVSGDQEYSVRHGLGYSRFNVNFPGLTCETTIHVAASDPVKFIRIALSNQREEALRLSLTYFVEWVLGVSREQTQMHVATEWDEESASLTARNAYHPELSNQVAFLYAEGNEISWTGDRTEFIGRNGDPSRPQALRHAVLSGNTGAGLDPGGAVQTQFVLGYGEKREIVFLLGAAKDIQEVRTLIDRYHNSEAAAHSLGEVQDEWKRNVGTIQVRTPNVALDMLVNHWLLYQTIACRLWARSALYQSGGAFGFRDQLQDVMAVVYSRPELAREQLLRAAARQFEEGDVQHWWHPPTGRGTRTRFSDDYLWLPLVTCHYVKITGDTSVLDEKANFLRSPVLEPHEHERYETPEFSQESASLFEHCRRTVSRAFRLGPHDLPLIGCGDWNDGMNKIGTLGQGESVWVGWFLMVILREFLPVMRERGHGSEADFLENAANSLRTSLESQAWDGGWYRRAYFDDGTPLGSLENDECRIDSIAQTWAVFAEADPERTKQAMEAVWQRLVRRKDGLVLLFEPAFDKTDLDPGYIKGYLPGIRENGGQYTHPALWVVQAFSQMGDADRAMQVFDLINPIHHASTEKQMEQYQVEPYVIAADVYGMPPNTGRGGWTWYTGSASWMYRVALESLLGLQRRASRLRISPCVPADWPKFEISYRWGTAIYHIVVINPGFTSEARITMDGNVLAAQEIELIDDGKRHEVIVAKSEVPASGADRMDLQMQHNESVRMRE